MFSLRPVLILVLVSLPAFTLPGLSQDTQEAFEEKLLAACDRNDLSSVKTLITEHRLWVKPVVNQLISDYIDLKLAGNESASLSRKESAQLLAHTYKEIYEERNLIIIVSYLDEWLNDDLEKKSQADSLVQLAIPIRYEEHEHEKAIQYYEEALSIYQELGDLHGEAVVFGAMGAIHMYRAYYWSLEELSFMLEFYQKSLEVRIAVEDQDLIARSLNDIGLYYYISNDYLTAIQYFEQAKVIREEIGDYKRLGSTLIYVTRCYESIGQYVKALDNYQIAYEINRKVDNKNRMAEAMQYSGGLLSSFGRYEEALQKLDTALAIRIAMEDQVGIGHVMNEQGNVYSNMGNHEMAIDAYSGAAEIFNALGDPEGQADIYNNIGTILEEIGRYEKAAEYYERSIKICEANGDLQGTVTALGNLGNVYYAQQDYVKAEEFQLQALEISQTQQYYEIEVHNLINLSNAQNALRKLDSAQINCQFALEKAKELESPYLIWVSTLNLGDNYEKRGEYSKALEYYESALDIVEKIRSSLSGEEFRISLMARERYAFEGVIHLLGRLHEIEPHKGYDEIAFLYAERSKSRTFLDMLTDTLQPASLPEVQHSLSSDETTVLEYFLGDSSSCLWVITEKEQNMLILPGRDEFADAIETIRFSLTQPDETNLEFFSETASFLYQQLIEPANQFVKKGNRLVIIPDGELFYLPFQVLLTREPGKGKGFKPSEWSYLIRRNPITYGHSASILMNMPQGTNIDNTRDLRLLAFGNPDFSTRFKRLEYSEEEVKSIASYFKTTRADVFLKQEASEERVKTSRLEGYNYIHFATHGTIDEVIPDLSSLILAEDSGRNEDGLLQAWEIAELKMNADLVVLSACQTGLGKMVHGEGLIGLTRSLIYSGASSVLVSLWSVADNSTSEFMTDFYRNLILNNMTSSTALQKTQLTMAADPRFSHPFYWAPFILIGNR